MNKLFVFIAFAVVFSNASAKDCHVGADPWKAGRQVQATEKEYRLNEPIEVVSLNSKGKPSGVCRLTVNESTIVIPNGFDPSVDHPGLPVDQLAWIKGCGNPIVSKFKLAITVAPVAVSLPPVAPAVQPAPQPVIVAQPALIKEGACSYGDRRGTYQMINGQIACLLDGVTRVTESYHRNEPEVVYVQPRQVRYEELPPQEDVYYEEPRQDSSWLPWAIGAGALAWGLNRHNSPAAVVAQTNRPPSVVTGPVGPGVTTGPAW